MNIREGGSTRTSEGYIPHRRHPMGFFMPVKLDLDMRNRHHGLCPPLRRDGRLVYALPGGGEFLGGAGRGRR